MAYVYRHIRLDKNVPFYVGIGSDNEGKYKRAFENGLRNRNKYWNNIVAITNYEIEIILDELTWEQACIKEMEFIELYKRKIDGGTLANLTLGGEGQLGMLGELNGMYGRKTTDAAKTKQRARKLGKPNLALKGIPRPPHVIEAVRKACTGRIAWNRGLPVPEEQKQKQIESIKGKLAGEKHPNFGNKMPDYIKQKLIAANTGRAPWNKGKNVASEKPPGTFAKRTMRRKIEQMDLSGNVIVEYDSLTAAARAMRCGKSSIGHACNGTRNIQTSHGFRWRYK